MSGFGSLPDDAVEPGRVIRRVGIVERAPAVRERVGAHWKPVAEIGGGFNYNWDIGCPGDDETKAVGLHAKAGRAGEDYRVWQEP